MIRAARPEDRRFIVPTWVHSFAEYAPWGPAATLGNHWRMVDAILDAHDTRVVVLASDEAARTVHCWAAASGETLHYVYVPPELRGHALGRKCITAILGCYPKRITTSHPWPPLKGHRHPHHRFRWNPYALPSAAPERRAA